MKKNKETHQNNDPNPFPFLIGKTADDFARGAKLMKQYENAQSNDISNKPNKMQEDEQRLTKPLVNLQ